MTPRVLDRHRERAERILERDYTKLRKTTIRGVRSRLAVRFVAAGRQFDDLDLDAFYNQAWHGLYLRLAQGEEIQNHAGFLVHASYCRAIEEIRRHQPAQFADGVDLDDLSVEPDYDALIDDHAQLTHFMEGMRERLTDRERKAATLCYIQGSTRPQAAEVLGVSPRRMEKLMDGVSAKIGVLLEDIRQGGWCESRSSLMKAYAFGVLDPGGERWELASAHLSECPGCRRYVRGLRGIAAVAPPIGIPIAAFAALGAGGTAAGAAAAGSGAGAGSAATAGATAQTASTAGVGSTATAAAGAGGGLGATAIAATAAVVVTAAAGIGGFAVTRGSDDTPDQPKPPAAAQVVSNPAPATTTATTAKKAAVKKKANAAKAKAAKKAKKKAQKAKTTPANNPAFTTTQSTTTQTAVPAAQTNTQPAATPQPSPSPRPTQPTGDAGQEFGFEK